MFKVKHQSDRRSGVFIDNFERISYLFLVFYCWRWTGKCLPRQSTTIWNIIIFSIASSISLKHYYYFALFSLEKRQL